MKTEYIITIVVIVPVIIFILLRKVYPDSNLFKINKVTSNAIIYALLLGAIAWHFYVKGIKMGIVAVALGGLAIGKYLFDMSKQEKEE